MKDHHVLGKYCSSPQIGSVEGEGPQTTLGADWTSGWWPLPACAEHTQASQVWAYQSWDCDPEFASQGSALDLTPTICIDSMRRNGGRGVLDIGKTIPKGKTQNTRVKLTALPTLTAGKTDRMNGRWCGELKWSR